jgi:hypothetical protein
MSGSAPSGAASASWSRTVTSASLPSSGCRIATASCRSAPRRAYLGAFTETLIRRRKRSGQPHGEEPPASGRGADGDDTAIGRGIRHTARCTTAGVTSLPDRRLRMIGAEHLVPERIRAPCRRSGRDGTGADDLPVTRPQRADTAIALAIGHRGRHATGCIVCPRARVDRQGPTLHGVRRTAVRAHQEALRRALRHHVADVRFPGGSRDGELEADAVTPQDIALAVGDTVVHGATGGGAERVVLVVANHEGGFGIRGGGRYGGDQLNGDYCGDGCAEPTCDAHILTAFLLRRTKLRRVLTS